MLGKSFLKRLIIPLLVTLAVLVFFSGVVVGESLKEKNLEKPLNIEAPNIPEVQLEAAPNAFATPWPTKAQGDVVVTAVGSWSYWWHPGDYAQGKRTTSLNSVNQLDYHMVIAENVLNSGGHCDLEFYLNGKLIGTFQVLENQFVLDFSWTFPAISGPTYELYMKETNLVEPGKGSFRLDSDKPGKVTLYEAGPGKPTIDIEAVPNPAKVGGPLKVLIDLNNPGGAFTARVGLYALVSGDLIPLLSVVANIPAGYSITDYPLFSVGSVPPGLPPTIAFLCALFNNATSELLDWDVDVVGITTAPSAADALALKKKAEEYVKEASVADFEEANPDILGKAKAAPPLIGQKANPKGKLSTTWGSIKGR